MIDINKSELKAFVRNVLGCGCPEEVFDRVAICSLPNNSNSSGDWKVVVGNRLLIHFREVGDTSSINLNLADWVKTGTFERDRNRYNRFRLVLYTDNVHSIQDKAEVCFRSLAFSDEKIHPHILEKKSVPKPQIINKF